jgi:hypothetical protein
VSANLCCLCRQRLVVKLGDPCRICRAAHARTRQVAVAVAQLHLRAEQVERRYAQRPPGQPLYTATYDGHEFDVVWNG